MADGGGRPHSKKRVVQQPVQGKATAAQLKCKHPGCSATFPNKKSLDNHLDQTNHRSSDKPSLPKEPDVVQQAVQGNGPQFVCKHPGCSATFPNKKSLKKHLDKTNHRSSDKPSLPKEPHAMHETADLRQTRGACFLCGEPGHKAAVCPRPKAAKGGKQPETQTCSTCGEGGHFARSCPRKGAQAPQISARVRKFLGYVSLSDLLTRYAHRRLRTVSITSSEDRDLWLQSWAAAAGGATPSPVRGEAIAGAGWSWDLVGALLRLPAQSALVPQADQVLAVLVHVLNGLATLAPAEALSRLEAVGQVVSERLLGREALVTDPSAAADQVDLLRTEFLRAVLHQLQRLDTALVPRAESLVGLGQMFNTYRQSLETSARSKLALAVDAEPHLALDQPWDAWCNATVGWLLHGAWLDVPALRRRYDSAEEYAETLSRMTTLLTFYWGAGALWPRCHNRQATVGGEDKMCNEPLLHTGGPVGNCNCGASAVWRCARGNHSGGVCANCLETHQRLLIGRPSQRASTDIYDAVVERETSRRDGQEALPATATIHWAEIVPVFVGQGQGPDRDSEHRARGRMALRLLTRNDAARMPVDADAALDVGQRIAIIDLRVFSPEVVPVLAICADPSLPHQLTQIPFIGNLIGRDPQRPSPLGHNSTADTVVQAIEHSDIDLIQRLTSEGRQRLIADLSGLTQRAGITGTQLDALTEALRSPIHCTQGPPGTGKVRKKDPTIVTRMSQSYVGVQLIIALDLVRRAATAAGQNVGPIVVLSYKNHALDELLVDVVHAAPGMNTQGRLIRCGNTENEELRPFTEQRSAAEHQAYKILDERLVCVRRARRISRDWLDLASHLNSFSGQETQAEISTWLEQWSSTPSSAETAPALSGVNAVATALALITQVMHHLAQDEATGPLQISDSPPKTAFKILSTANRFDDQSDRAWISAEDGVRLRELEAAIEKLKSGAEHWIVDVPRRKQFADHRALFLIRTWLTGQNPPPRCIATLDDAESRCLQVAGNGEYCDAFHACHARTGDLRCPNKRTILTGIMFCDEHRCLFERDEELCSDPRVPGGSFCRNHSCPGCMTAEANPIRAKDPHACIQHQCDDVSCIQPQLSPTLLYCEHHCCRLCSTRGVEQRALERVPGHDLCREHKCQVTSCSRVRSRGKLPGDNGPPQEQRYCAQHCCQACDGLRDVVDVKLPRLRLCFNHRCTQADCLTRREQRSDFCEQHTCQVCRDRGLPLKNPVVDSFPRNVCADHPLCTHITKSGHLCRTPLDNPFSELCREHIGAWAPPKMGSTSEEAKCNGTTTKGRPCRSTGYSQNPESFYCDAHLDQAPPADASSDSDSEAWISDESSDEDGFMTPDSDAEHADWAIVAQSVDPATCHGITSKGRPCKTTGPSSASGTFYCQDHLLQRPFSTKAASPKLSDNDSLAASSNLEAPPDCTETSRSPSPRLVCPDDSLSVTNFDQDDFSLREMVLRSRKSVRSTTEEAESVRSAVSSLPDPPPPPPCVPRTPTKSSIAILPAGSHNDTPSSESASDDGKMDGDFEASADPIEEAVAGDVHPDEMELWVDSESESDQELEEEDAEAQRRREIGGGASDLEEEIESDIESESGGQNETSQMSPSVSLDPRSLLENCKQWSWDERPSERLARAAQLLQGAAGALAHLRVAAEAHLAAARHDHAEASAQTLKAARVIGSTVVGAARRLEAIRAAEPFAVVVEEACEVMEPTLMSVLSVRSLRKLELIGDHRQLPAFVQNCWFNLEVSTPSIKLSLFERLITSGKHGRDTGAEPPVGCTVLDEQRRMHPVIADLTRHHYDDLVNIQDHPCTIAQRVGDVVARKPSTQAAKRLLAERGLWASGGASFPGLVHRVFFWDVLDNREGRPVAGLSACNYVEAEAVVALVKWFQACGVPDDGISVITPYKGQKTLILRSLRKAGAVKHRTQRDVGGHSRKFPGKRPIPKAKEFDAGPEVTVSTVDRYQGDENDVVILSLVRTRPGNRFVALVNRFIVAASRARLGFCIVGSAEGVTGGGKQSGTHWQRFVRTLHQPVEDPVSASQEIEPQGEVEAASEVGMVLRSGKRKGGDRGGQRKGEECQPPNDACTAALQTRIGSAIPICCPRHPSTLKMVKHPSAFPSTAKWSVFCALPCSHPLDCGHECGAPCHSPNLVPHATACLVHVQRPCPDHSEVPLLCSQVYRQGTKGSSLESALKAFRCEVLVSIRRAECDHVQEFACHHYKELQRTQQPLPPCKNTDADYSHPICGHVVRNPTCEDRRRWEQQSPQCLQEVSHRRDCGHTVKLKCWEAEREATEGDNAVVAKQCTRGVELRRPRCSHPVSLRCFVARNLEQRWVEQSGHEATRVQTDDPSSVTVEHGQDYGPPESELMLQGHTLPQCSGPARYRGDCGHVRADVRCQQAFRWALGLEAPEPCTASVSFSSPLCGHSVSGPCWLASFQFWGSAGRPFLVEDGAETIVVPESELLAATWEAPANVDKALARLCHQHVVIARQCGAGHETRVPCASLLSFVKGQPLPPCSHRRDRALQCGHVVSVKCHRMTEGLPTCRAVIVDPFLLPCGRHSVQPGTCNKLQALKALGPNAPCHELVECPRFRCGHIARVPCRMEGDVVKAWPGLRVDAVRGVPILATEIYCQPILSEEIPRCAEPVTFSALCGHDLQDIPCDVAFNWASGDAEPPQCEHRVEVTSPLCGHDLIVSCHEANVLSDWAPWGEAGLLPDEVTQGFDEDGTSFISPIFKHDAPQPLPPPKNFPRASLNCGRESVVIHMCGHSRHLRCTDVADELSKGLCNEPTLVICPTCEHEQTVACHAAEREVICQNPVEKLCTLCGINTVKTECFKQNVQCDAEASAVLDCGHEMSWNCGHEPDPRLGDAQCIECVLPAWTAILELDERGLARLPHRLLEHTHMAIPPGVQAVGEQLIPKLTARVDQLRRAHATIVKTYQDRLMGELQNGTHDLPVTLPPNVLDPDHYEIVFAVSKCKQKPEESFLSKQTDYGLGQELNPLTLNNLLRCCQPDQDGLVTVVVGVALVHHPLRETPPFKVHSVGRRRQRALNQANKAANNLRSQKVKAGYDYVIRPAEIETDAARVYWLPSAAIPVSIVTLRIHSQCSVCLEHCAANDGCCCPSSQQHFVCWECFAQLANQAMTAGSLQRTADAHGNLRCQNEGCEMIYSVQLLAAYPRSDGRDQAMQSLVAVKCAADVERQIPVAVETTKAAMEAEFRRIQAITNRAERLAEIIVQELADHVLTLKCPCGAAFVDFDGCFALTCSRCHQPFCAWCLQRSPGEIHHHVQTCPRNPGNTYYGTQQEFNQFHAERKRRLVQERIEREEEEVKDKVMQRLVEQLRA